jgi:four helix bundle protein
LKSVKKNQLESGMGDIHSLQIYIKSKSLVTKIYSLTQNDKKLSRDFGLCDQIRRAAVSVSCNISEGYYRSRKQTKNYLEIASGSTNEVATLLEIIHEVYLIETKDLQEEYQYLGKQINTFSARF